jgi:predicted MFS family arabinose efflux permease
VFLGRFSGRLGDNAVVIAGIILQAACLVCIPFMRSLAGLLVLAFPLGVSLGAVGPEMNAIMFKRCSAQRRGTVSAAFFAAIDTGFCVGSTSFGFLVDRFGYPTAYLVMASVTVAALAVYLFGVSKHVRQMQTVVENGDEMHGEGAALPGQSQ